MLIVNEGLLVAVALETCDAKGLNAEFRLVSSTAGILSPLVSFWVFTFAFQFEVTVPNDMYALIQKYGGEE